MAATYFAQRRVRRLLVALVALAALHFDTLDLFDGGLGRGGRRGAASACYLQGTDSGECTTKSQDVAWLEENMPYCQIPMRILPNSLFPVCIPKFQVCAGSPGGPPPRSTSAYSPHSLTTALLRLSLRDRRYRRAASSPQVVGSTTR